MKEHRRTIRRGRRLVAGVALGIGLSAASVPAHAGTYDVYACKDPVTGAPIGLATPSGWAQNESTNEGNFAGGGDCDRSSGRLQLYPNSGGSMPQGRHGTIDFTAPPNTVLRAYDLYRSMTVSSGPYVVGTYVAGGWAERCFAAFASCRYGDGNSPFAAGNHLSATLGGQGAPGLSLQVFCDGTCPKDPAAANASVFSARMTLEETDRPTFTSPPAGSLLDSGVISGSRTLDFVAADVGSGVHRVTVSSSAAPGSPIVAKVIDSGNGHCDTARFTYVVPCPLSIDDSVNVDTLQFPDGSQTITITLEDAAGNTKAVSRSVTVKNAPDNTTAPSITGSASPKAGDELTCNPGSFSPAPDRIEYAWLVGGVRNEAASSAKYTVRATDVGKPIVCRVTAFRGGGSTTVESAPVGGGTQSGSTATSSNANGPATSTTSGANGGTSAVNNPADANGSGGLVTSARFSAASRKTRRIRYGQKVTLSGQLIDADGRPIVGASVDVFSAIARKNAVRRKVGTVVTDGDGVYRWVAPVGVSRRVRFAYRATTSASDYRAQVDIALRVRAKLALRAVSTRVRSFGRMHLRGRLFGRGLPARGAIVEIQYRDGTHWETAKVRRTKKKGRFAFDYRFKRTAHGSFTFRAQMRSQTGVPLMGAASKPVLIRVG